MSARTSKATLIYSVVLVLLFLGNAAHAQQQHPVRKRSAKQQVPDPPPPPAPPPPPPTLEQLPAVPPKVTYSNGLLTIVAENSTLADILRAVRVRTGAVVEVPSNATERVVAHLGPGPARSVLASLLNGSHFNYVMLGSPTNPDKVDRVILTSKSGGNPDAGAPPPTPVQAQEGNMAPPEDEPDGPPQADIAEQPVEDSGDNTGHDNQPQPPNGQPQIKTPEQLLRELQQQQIQQQQQQQQPAQNPPQQ